MVDPLVADYLANLATQNAKSAQTISFYMTDFEQFVKRQLGIADISALLAAIKERPTDVYEILRRYTMHLVKTRMEKGDISAKTLGYKVKYAKRLLEFLDVDITPTKFRIKVKIPRNVDGEKTPLDKKTIRTILNACDDPRLKTFILWLATSGWRAKESLALKLENFDFTTNPITVHISGRYTKTRKGRHTWLTQEMASQLNEYLSWKYRRRVIKYNYDKRTGKYEEKVIMPERKLSDYIFLPYHDDHQHHYYYYSEKDNPRKLDFAYTRLHVRFAELLKRLGIGGEAEGKRKKVTFHSFRRHVYTTIEGLGLSQFAEFYIGHATSEYWSKPEAEKIQTFRRVEPYLAYLDVTNLEARGADMVTKLEQKEVEIADLRKRQASLEAFVQSLIDSGQLKPPNQNVNVKG